MHAGEAVYLLNALLDYHGRASSHPGNQAQIKAGREAMAVLLQTLRIPPPDAVTADAWLRHVQGIYTAGANTPARQERNVECDAHILAGFVQKAQDIIDKCDTLLSPHNEPEAIGFASGLKQRTESMLQWMHTNQHCTIKMQAALTNMNDAIDQWLKPAHKNDYDEPDDNIPF